LERRGSQTSFAGRIKGTLMLSKAKWIWCKTKGENCYCYFRKDFVIDETLLQAKLQITADTNYQVWINGRYVGQGPCPGKWPTVFVDEYNVARHVESGKNTICVLVHYPAVTTNIHVPHHSGLAAELILDDADGNRDVIATGGRWKAKASRAWRKKVPRRTHATGFCECYDARKAPRNWLEIHFNDTQWPAAVEVRPGKAVFLPRMVPPLKEFFQAPAKLKDIWKIKSNDWPKDLSKLTPFMDTEPIEKWESSRAKELKRKFSTACSDMAAKSIKPGAALTFDFGEQTVGQIEFDLEAPAGVVIDFYGTETLRKGRPWGFRKNGNYASRYVTRNGRQQWRTFGWTGLRYLHIVFRNGNDKILLHRIGVHYRASDTPYTASFSCSDPLINDIWEIGLRTIQLCKQEVSVDCPTREQAAYWHDGILVGLWSLYLTGDASHLKHLLLSGEYTQLPDGQLSSPVFAPVQILLDGSLFYLWGLEQY